MGEKLQRLDPVGLLILLAAFVSLLPSTRWGWDEVSMVGFSRHRLLRRLRRTYRRVCGSPDLDERSASSHDMTFECSDADAMISAPVSLHG